MEFPPVPEMFRECKAVDRIMSIDKKSVEIWERYWTNVKAVNTKTTKDIKQLILDAAAALRQTEEYKDQPNKVCARLCKDCPYAESYIREVLPDEFKDLTKSNNAKQRFATPTEQDVRNEFIELYDLLVKCADKGFRDVDAEYLAQVYSLVQRLKKKLLGLTVTESVTSL